MGFSLTSGVCKFISKEQKMNQSIIWNILLWHFPNHVPPILFFSILTNKILKDWLCSLTLLFMLLPEMKTEMAQRGSSDGTPKTTEKRTGDSSATATDQDKLKQLY